MDFRQFVSSFFVAWLCERSLQKNNLQIAAELGVTKRHRIHHETRSCSRRILMSCPLFYVYHRENSMNKNAIRHKLIVLAVLPLASSFANAGSYDDRIQPYALLPYTEQSYPKTVREFRSRLPEIEAYRRKIAEIALDSNKCDKVEMSELST